ncbi:MAG: hypothetical protein ACRD15_21940 [Vicinamibacterales bacterium]
MSVPDPGDLCFMSARELVTLNPKSSGVRARGVRKARPHAVETDEQRAALEQFETKRIRERRNLDEPTS